MSYIYLNKYKRFLKCSEAPDLLDQYVRLSPSSLGIPFDVTALQNESLNLINSPETDPRFSNSFSRNEIDRVAPPAARNPPSRASTPPQPIKRDPST